MKYRAWIGQAVAALSDGKAASKKDGYKKRDPQSGSRRKQEDQKGDNVSPSPPKLSIAEEFLSEKWKLRLESPKPLEVIKAKKVAPIEIEMPQVLASKLRLEDESKWTISGSASSETLPMRSDSKASTSSASTTTLSTITEPMDEIGCSEDNEAAHPISTLDSSFQTQDQTDPLRRHRSKSTSSTIFQYSPTAPITIILTTPDSDPSPSIAPHYHHPPTLSRPSMSKSKSYLATRTSRSYSTPSLTSLHSPSYSRDPSHLHPHNASTTSLPSTRFIPDPTRLMPPSEQALDLSRLRKAQEFREVRKFMIGFLNTKGHTFPMKLRVRIMQGYGIEERELDPETVRQFNQASLSENSGEGKGEMTDEGVYLDGISSKERDRKGKELSNTENLQILSLAFQSQIPVVTPHLEDAYLKAIPGRLPSSSLNPNTRKSSTKTTREKREMRLLGRTLSTSNLPLRQAETKSRSIGFSDLLRASTSVPDPSRRRLSSSSSASSIVPTPPTSLPPHIHRDASISSRQRRNGNQTQTQTQAEKSRERNMTPIPIERQLKIAEQQTRIKRQSIISGAFGAVRTAMGSSGSKVGKESERLRMVREGR